MNRRLLILSIFLLLLQCRSAFASTAADALVADAWKAWEKNNQQLVESKFLAAIKEDPRNTRAALGLTLLYIVQKKNAASLERLKTVLETEPDSYPYLYSLWTTAAMRNRYYDMNVNLVPLIEQWSRKADSGGVSKPWRPRFWAHISNEEGILLLQIDTISKSMRSRIGC